MLQMKLCGDLVLRQRCEPVSVITPELLKIMDEMVEMMDRDTILSADEILVLKDGEIAERGQHADLVKLGGVYTELYETQFKRALETMEEAEKEES